MDLHATSRLAGAFCWVETQLFEILGRWMHEVDDNDTVVFLGERCTVHGLHLQAWASRIAASPGVDADAVVAPASENDAQLLAALGADVGDTASRCAHYDRVHAHLNAQYRACLAAIDPRIDEPTHRLLLRMLGQPRSAQ